MPNPAQKPFLGATIDPAHPLASGLLVAVLFNEGGLLTYPIPTVLFGTALPVGLAPLTLGLYTSGGGFTDDRWHSAREGWGYKLTKDNAWFTAEVLNVSAPGHSDVDWLPTTATTVCIIRRKLDTTLRAGGLFGLKTAGSGQLLQAFVPYTDGTVYWDFGGASSAPNRLSVAGLTFVATPERWIFTAGPQGSTIWRNGLKVASQATAITRSNPVGAGPQLALNSETSGNGDNQELYYFALYNTQWSDALCQWWSAEPYAHFVQSLTAIGRSKPRGGSAAVAAAVAAANAAASAGHGGLTTLGVG